MDQLIFASLSHTHYWYEVDMLKVPAVYICYDHKEPCTTVCARYQSINQYDGVGRRKSGPTVYRATSGRLA